MEGGTVNLLRQNLLKTDYLKYFSNMSDLAGAKVFEYKGGMKEGVKGIDVKTGTGFKFTVVPDRGMDILDSEYCGIPISWVSKNRIMHPTYFENGGIGFLRSFSGGLITTCGLTSAGDPCVDGEEILGIHDRINHIPAENLCVEEYWDNDEYIIRIRGQMRQCSLYRENLVLKREIICKMGENKLYVNDEFVNEGYQKTPFMFVYHINFSFPIISPDSKLYLPAIDVKPWNQPAKNGSGIWDRFIEPKAGFEYEVFEVVMPQDKDKVYAAYINEKINFGAYIKYSTKQMPSAVEWINSAPQEYVAAIEPGNTVVWGRKLAKEQGVLKYIQPGESYKVNYEIGLMTNETEINKVKKLIEIN